MNDYTKEIEVCNNIFTLVLDESITHEFCTIKKYAGNMEIRVNPLIIKIFHPDDVINFAAWKYLVSIATNEEELDKFVKEKFSSEIFTSIVAVSYIFKMESSEDTSTIMKLMTIINSINNPTCIIDDDEYKLAKNEEDYKLLKSIAEPITSKQLKTPVYRTSDDESSNDEQVRSPIYHTFGDAITQHGQKVSTKSPSVGEEYAFASK